MSELEYSIRKLDEAHSKNSFDSGILQLNHYLVCQARQDIKRCVAVVYILGKLHSNDVIGYYTLSATNIELKNLSEQEAKKLPRYPLLPATLIGRLAVDKEYQCKGIGRLLLVHALRMSLENSGKVASMAVVVDAKDDQTAQFYQHFGFLSFSDTPGKLYLPMGTVGKMGF